MGMGVEGSVQPRLRGAARGVSRLEAVEPVLGRDQVVSREVICSRGRGGVAEIRGGKGEDIVSVCVCVWLQGSSRLEVEAHRSRVPPPPP